MERRIARVFPARTTATPTDSLVFATVPPLLAMPEIDEVHVSVTFSYDKQYAEWLAEQWQAVGVPVYVGGPAYGYSGGDFIPGMYLKHGYSTTSRGCPTKKSCWFCTVGEREGPLRELPIRDGWRILDNNILACSDDHIRAVFDMLKRQPHPPVFTGGLDAYRLKPWHVELLREVRAQRFYFAYDDPADYETLVAAGRMLRDGGITKASHKAASYVLIGYPGDTLSAAERRLHEAWEAGFVPFAMLFKDESGVVDREWSKFQRIWLRPGIVMSQLMERSI